MFAYIVRRCLYAIPTLIGVNVIVFGVFFFVNTPDDMARAHGGGKRVTRENIEKWKREHSLDLPYFYNSGWREAASVSAHDKENNFTVETLPEGNYALIVEAASNPKEAQSRTIIVKCAASQRLVLPTGFDADGKMVLPAETKDRRFEFKIQGPQPPQSPVPAGQSAAALTVSFNLEKPSPANRIVLEYQGELALGARLTQTIFFQRSMKMLWFKYGKSDDGKDIAEEIMKRAVPSLTIAVPALFFALFLNVLFAMLAAFYRGTYLDYWGVFICVLMMSISAMFYIMGGQLLAGKALRLVPISGYDYGVESLKFIILPIFIIVVSEFGGSVRFYRTVFLEEINREYVRTARAKGLPETSVLFLHALKNAMLPILTGVVAGLPFLFTGDLLLESFFAVPGMGSYTLDALRSQDFAVTQAMVSLGSFIYIIALMLTDISYTLVDPRVRLS